MATIFNKENVLNVLGRVLDFIKEAFAALFLVIVVILMWCIAMPVMTITVFNPVIFPVWAMLWPQKMAQSLFAHDDTEGGWLTNNLNAFWQWLLLWEVRLMPWHARWCFIHEAPKHFSKKNLLKYYRLAKDKVGALKHLNHRNADISDDVWNAADTGKSDYKDCLAVVKACKSYNPEHISFMLLHEDLHKMLCTYAQQNTLSAEVLELLAKDSVSVSKVILRQQVITNGLPAILINEFVGKGGELAKNVSEWLEIYGQRKITLSANEQDWQEFCQKTPNICAEAQKLMTQKQLAIFYASEHKMTEDALFNFLSRAAKNMRDYKEVVKLIFSHEDDAMLSTPRVTALINAEPGLAMMHLKK